jgi:CubicO group peptidase (beta-lactamase class C family)
VVTPFATPRNARACYEVHMTMHRWRQRWVTYSVAVAVLALAVGCAGSPSPATDARKAPSASAQRVSAAELDRRIQDFFNLSYTGAYDNVRAVLVNVHGKPLLERYYGSSASATSNVFSVTKSVTSMLIGIAIDEGHIQSVDQSLEELLPSYRKYMTPQVKDTTLRQVLTMTAGFSAIEIAGSPDFMASPNWVASILRSPEQPAGQGFRYSDASSHLLSAIVATATKRSTLQFAREKLFHPLNIDTDPALEPLARKENLPAYNRAAFAWPKDPQGYHIGSCCLKMTARDMAKLGQLWLDKGRWQGSQVVSAAWVDESTRPHIRAVGNAPAAEHYGYQWWTGTLNGHAAFAAIGLGGQLIEVVPHLGLVVAVSSSADETGNATALEVVSEVIVPAVNK